VDLLEQPPGRAHQHTQLGHAVGVEICVEPDIAIFELQELVGPREERRAQLRLDPAGLRE
jgi:hypothetical protein